MLGLQSHLSQQKQVNNLSISSNAHKDRSTKNISVRHTSTLNSQGGTYSQDSSNIKGEKIRKLRYKMQQIAKNQQEMDKRMKMFVVLAEKEVQKKEEQNLELTKIIANLKLELEQSRNDIGILSNYVNKNVLASPQKEKPSRNKYFKQSSKSQTIIGEISKENKLLVLDRSKDHSPVNKDQRKLNMTSGTMNQQLYRKPKSPFK